MHGSLNDDLCREALDKIPVAVWILDPLGRTVFASARLAEMLGARAADLVGATSFGDLVEGVGTQVTSEPRESRPGAEGPRGRLRLRRRGGPSLLVEVATRSLVGPDGIPRGLMLIVDEAA
jgi:hypothetical protein